MFFIFSGSCLFLSLPSFHLFPPSLFSFPSIPFFIYFLSLFILCKPFWLLFLSFPCSFLLCCWFLSLANSSHSFIIFFLWFYFYLFLSTVLTVSFLPFSNELSFVVHSSLPSLHLIIIIFSQTRSISSFLYHVIKRKHFFHSPLNFPFLLLSTHSCHFCFQRSKTLLNYSNLWYDVILL